MGRRNSPEQFACSCFTDDWYFAFVGGCAAAKKVWKAVVKKKGFTALGLIE
jgi:hypothetical protein